MSDIYFWGMWLLECHLGCRKVDPNLICGMMGPIGLRLDVSNALLVGWRLGLGQTRSPVCIKGLA